MNTIELIETPSNHPELRRLVEQLDQYLFTLYPPEEVFGVDFESPATEEIEFVLAYTEGKAVGCGAIKKYDEKSVELKRFYVDEKYRNNGIAGRILNRLEEKARLKKYETLKLETGIQQVEAISFYKKYGYKEIDKFGEYTECASSICFEKQL